MRQEQRKKQKDKVAIVLMLCFCVIALTSIFTIKSNVAKINKSAQGNEIPASDQTKVPEKESPSQGSASSEQADREQSLQEKAKLQSGENPDVAEVSSQVPVLDSTDNPNGRTGETGGKYPCPVENSQYQITNKFSMDGLIYSKTLDQYMTHQGVDIEAPLGAPVISVSEGTVTSVYVDDRFGSSIAVTHSGGIKTIYSNLDTTHKVEMGDVVSRGTVISSVGQSGAFEALEPPHLHFEIIKDGKYADPAQYVVF